MRVLVQRVSRAQVVVEGETVGRIDEGLVLLVGIQTSDTAAVLDWCADKCAHLRVFADAAGKMNRSLLDSGGQILAISQFTLYGDTRRGRRPGFSQAAPPEIAAPLFDRFVAALKALGIVVEQGVFGAHMEVEIHNDGPVTLMVEHP
ncbi:MAG: D-tyrosyl-tRNA(Tyr) deacylase [Candidatus Latescibacteria bacterium]|nr:D-tyrosyl-tRNA(Tyr) deacylase [Candidatus Latescibacterota bacterium]